MAKKMLIDATHAEETRVVVVDGNKVEEFDFESQSRRQLAGNIFLAKVTRVEPSLQAAFVDYGGNRHGFLAFSEIHPDYYQIPVADREALIAEEKAYAESLAAEAEKEAEQPSRSKRRRRSRGKAAAKEGSADAVLTQEVANETVDGSITGMETIDFGDDDADDNALVSEVAATEPEGEAGATEVSSVNASEDQTGSFSEQDDDGVEENDDSADDENAADDDGSEDDGIESVADEDDSDDVRPVRKPRPKRYKIQEVIKVRQILLIQVVKEERGNKGAALTTYLSLAGRYCVLMPNTARGGGISRKITNANDRKRLKQIANELDVPEGAGLIVRTAGSQRTKAEIKRDYEYLQRLWEQIRELTLKSIAPSKIYEEGDLIKRTIRDLYSKEIDEVIVAGEQGYRVAKDFMKMIMPSHAKNVKQYADQLPLFARYQVEGYLAGMFNPVVQLPSGGYIVIGVTEALVAIDVNSGRATKEGSIEQTALKTNLEAAAEVARQLRLRDLAGLIVIDFIDMDERRNNNAVEKLLKDKLKTDRARIQVGRISGFGLLEMSRQRLRPGMLEATTQPCPHCHGTGLLRSDENVALAILRQLEEEGVRGRTKEALVRAPISIVNFLINQKREHVADIEARYGMSVRIEVDPSLVSPDFAIEKFKTATRVVAEVEPVVTATSEMMDSVDDEPEVEQEAETTEDDSASDKPKKRRRRRRRRRNSGGEDENGTTQNTEEQSESSTEAASATETSGAEEGTTEPAEEDKPKKRTRSRRKKTDTVVEAAETSEDSAQADDTAAAPAVEQAEEQEKPKRKPRARKKKSEVDEVATPAADGAETATVEPAAAEAEEKPKRRRTRKKVEPEKAQEAPQSAPEAAAEPEKGASEEAQPGATEAQPTVEEAVAVVEEPPAEAKPKRRGWWSLGK
ncbi:Rne/Rng family ribonuclease [Pelagovum sp. HNIBRBA483]|uniref:Rne/Rng family ribonuclease n=1 Tax=Pelagovum sp. HNIBRBA483 TaxID=3233341 RepID=UPI0034A20103